MSWNPEIFRESFELALGQFDRRAIDALCNRLVDAIHAGQASFSPPSADQVLEQLQRKRLFDLQARVADAFIRTGMDTATVRRRYAQSLLDRGLLSAAIPFLEDLLRNLPPGEAGEAERPEAIGLLGRAWKQAFVRLHPGRPEHALEALDRSIAYYHGEYRQLPDERAWHGTNACALLAAADRHGLAVSGFRDPGGSAQVIAQKILNEMRQRWLDWQVKMWDASTALEACLALDEHEEAVTWLKRYLREPGADAFEIGSTLRQLEEVWEIDIDSPLGSKLLPVLRAELLMRTGGGVEASASQLRTGALAGAAPDQLEKVFGPVRYQSFRFMQRSIDCARAVARIESSQGQGIGTGFLLRGGDLLPDWGDDLVLLTNAHVISDPDSVRDALAPEDASVTFQLLREEGQADDEYFIESLLWTSPPWDLDVSILRLEDVPNGINPYRVHPRLPVPDGEQRVYIIGHPRGGSLSFSIQDNILLDHEAPYLHYRAPTEGGSSGSPVFNAQWRLIGLHHAGDHAMRRLNDKPGTYEANEGIWIQSIIQGIAADLGAS